MPCTSRNRVAFLSTVASVGQSPQACAPPLNYNVGTTNNGVHQFAVEAVDAAGNVSGGIFYSWKVAAGSLQEFTINGNGSTPLYPGAPALPFNTANEAAKPAAGPSIHDELAALARPRKHY